MSKKLTKEAIPDFTVLKWGLLYAAVCSSLTPEETTRRLNREMPSGTRNGWTLSEQSFADGLPNPCPCPECKKTHKHYLYEC
jgi:hypothetical protein